MNEKKGAEKPVDSIKAPLNSKVDEPDSQQASTNKAQESIKRSIGIYARLVGRKAGSVPENSAVTSSPSLRDKITNFFARDSADVGSLVV